jgi:hypothetical protein
LFLLLLLLLLLLTARFFIFFLFWNDEEVMKFMAHFDKATLASIVQVIDGDEHFAQVEVFGLGL